MFKSFFTFAFRNLKKNPGFSVINILGLASGLASAMLILIWIEHEVNFDQFHEKKERIYEAWNRFSFSGELNCWNTTPKVLAKTLEQDIPGIERTARADWSRQRLLAVGEKRLNGSGFYTDPGFLEIFSFPLLKGHPKTVLNELNSIVLTESMARKLFGEEDPMGKTIKIDNKYLVAVSGILKDIPKNTRFQLDYLLNWKHMEANEGGVDDNWGNNSTRTYVLLQPEADLSKIQTQLKTLKPKYDPTEPKWEMFIYPLSRWNLYSSFSNGVETGGLITFVWLFGIIAGFVLVIACINFMNLSTARSERRAKEVGIRKTLGANKFSLVFQFLTESVLMALLAGILAIGLLYLALPAFNQLAEKDFVIGWAKPEYWMVFLLFVLVTGLLAGSYPAFFLSRFEPVRVLKGTYQPVKSALAPRKILVVFQFSVAIALIVGTIIVRQQIQFAKDRELGYNKNNLLYTWISEEVRNNLVALKTELISSGVASNITATSSPITQCWSDGWGMEWEGKDPSDKTDIDRFTCDGPLVNTFGMRLIAGRDFDLGKFPTDSIGMIINESSLKLMKFKNPIGQVIKDNDVEWHVIGVVKNFIMRSPYSPHKPLIISGPKSKWFNALHIKLNEDRPLSQSLATMERIFKKYNPEYPFNPNFIDKDYAQKFEDENKIGTMAGVFAWLTIFISCMGLFGLATYMAENRTKEIGIRKVLGSSVVGIVRLLSRDFIVLVLIAFVIATPVAWWALAKWLEDYTYRVEISWYVFAASGVLAVLIALITVSYQAIRAAIANPVKSLRTE
jgi:putative ABC transport system permease protein